LGGLPRGGARAEAAELLLLRQLLLQNDSVFFEHEHRATPPAAACQGFDRSPVWSHS
jgi:hypothetical protein